MSPPIIIRNVADACRHGYDVCRGSYVTTSGDRLDRWYVDKDGQLRDHSGRGYRTRRLALNAVSAAVNDIQQLERD